MFKNNNKPLSLAEMLGVTPIVSITPDEIWAELITPQTRAMLGPIESVKISVRDTVAGDFPGDEVSNLNQHAIGGDTGRVRYPYVNCFYKTKWGALTIKYDPTKVKVSGWFGDLRSPQLIFKLALRDRRYDATPRANDCSLLDFMGYHEQINKPLEFPGKPEGSSAVELSVYTFMPGSRIAEACGDTELERFVENPFQFVKEPEKFLKLFDQAWKSQRAPGQWGNPIPDVAKFILPVVDDMARRNGYDYIENCSSHYHVYKVTEWWGYRIADPQIQAVMDQFNRGIKSLKDKGIKLTRTQESWVCVVQSLPEEYIPAHLNLHGPKWPQDNITPVSLWMYKPLSERAVSAAKHQADLATRAAAAAALEVATKVEVASATTSVAVPATVDTPALGAAAAPVVGDAAVVAVPDVATPHGSKPSGQ
ncbi:MAG: hypothetical protein IPL73_21570 [Candidatus Obscuribacter sp.]|jgi:hypothetical protein|nr:hypothetical protein [Candidatus Obscuribacter sp.]MBK7841621.1 hypothetical protein [Candidatus Obscuribacter sp.]MBK9204972.1 hypothetical protein [Candidatus Obscuribacter sp.]